MSVGIHVLSRSEKLTAANGVCDALKARKHRGPPEPTLDAYIPELTSVITGLGAHVSAQGDASDAHSARVARVESADIVVDTWLRHIVNFITVEANRRAGTYLAAARSLADAACPDGLAHVDDRIVEENAHCRDMLRTLRAPEHASIVHALELPAAWLTKLETALDESDAAINAVIEARDDASQHVTLGRNAETDWQDIMVRLRRYVASRAKRGDVERQTENRQLLGPLLDAVARHQAEAQSRATRRKHTAPSTTPGAPGTTGTPTS